MSWEQSTRSSADCFLALYGVLIGAVLGALAGHLLHLGRHDFSSVGTLRVGRYEVVADSEVAERASALLASGG